MGGGDEFYDAAAAYVGGQGGKEVGKWKEWGIKGGTNWQG